MATRSEQRAVNLAGLVQGITLVDNGVALSTIIGWTAVTAVAMAALAMVVVRREPVPAAA